MTYMLVGNKSDRRDRMVTSDQGQQLARELDMPFTETSAKDSHNIDHLFLALGMILIDKKPKAGATSSELNSITLNEPEGGQQRRSTCWGWC